MKATEGLGQKQKEMLWWLYHDGALPTSDGLVWESDPGDRLDMRTVNSLMARGLVSYRMSTRGGRYMGAFPFLTAIGEKLVEQWEEQGYDPTKRRLYQPPNGPNA